MKEKIRRWFVRWLQIDTMQNHIDVIEKLILHEDSRVNGFAVLKKHLNRPDKPLPTFMGKRIKQD